MTQERSDQDSARLIEAARRGSKDAFCELVRIHQARVRTYLSRFVRHQALEDDVAQETFFTAYANLHSYDGRTPFRSWLLGIARNRALEFFRQQRRGSGAGSLAELWARRIESDTASPDRERELVALRTCVEGLPEKSAALVREYYYQRSGAAEIARKRRTSENVIWVTILRIRQALRRCVESRLAEAGSP